jgi:hypothetical protein
MMMQDTTSMMMQDVMMMQDTTSMMMQDVLMMQDTTYSHTDKKSCRCMHMMNESIRRIHVSVVITGAGWCV